MFRISIIAVAIALFSLNRADAQEPKHDFTVDAAMQRLAPEKQDGRPIANGDRIWAGVVSALGFVVVAIIIRDSIRRLAKILIWLIFCGGIILLWALAEDGKLHTWEALATAAAIVGVFAGTMTAILGPFALDHGPSMKDHRALSAAQTANEKLIQTLAGELELLKKQLGGAATTSPTN